MLKALLELVFLYKYLYSLQKWDAPLGNPQPSQPLYGLVTDGDLFMFVKLTQENTEIIYDFSEPFSLLVARRHKLYQILQILKNISEVVGEERISLN